VGPKLNGTHPLLAYADKVNLQGDNMDTRKKITETVIDAIKEAGLEINVENAGQNTDIKIENRSFENVTVQIFGNINKSKYDSGD
jgi:hypothetical protein